MIHKFITLGELMKRFNPRLSILCVQLSDLAGAANAFSFFYQNAPQPQRQQALTLPANQVPPLKQLIADIAAECKHVGLQFSGTNADKLLSDLSSANMQTTDFKARCSELLRRIEDELNISVLFSIPSDKQHLITEPHLFGEEVGTAFPSAIVDIEEAGKCMAFDRWTASVFHSMRVLEIGLSALAKDVGVSKIDYRNWESLIQDVETNIKTASGGSKVKEQFYSESALQFRYFKNAWRNHVMHVRDTYDEERAETIFRHVKEFMAHLATKLKEDTP